MSTRKAKNYTRVLDYLYDSDRALYDFIDEHGLDYLLSPKGKTGLTFLLPRDEAERKKLFSADDTTATNLFSALVIHECLKSPADWRRQDEIVNTLKQCLDVDRSLTNTTSVHFKSGAVAEIDYVFKDGCKREGLVVYELVSGTIPIDGRPWVKPTGKPKQKSAPSPTIDVAKFDSVRFRLGAEVENTYLYRRRTEGAGVDEYRDVVLGFISWLIRHKDKKMANDLLFECVLPMVSRVWSADFYNIFETRSISATYLIPDIVLEEWMQVRKQKTPWKETVEKMEKYLDSFANQEKYPGVYSARVRVLNATDTVRCRLTNLPLKDLVEKTRQEYRKVSADNAIEGMTNIFPESLAAAYKRDLDRKLLEDELRHYLLLEFSRMDRLSSSDLVSEYTELMERLNDYLVTYTAGGYVPAGLRLRLFNVEIARCLNSDVKREQAEVFIQSSNFLFIPLSAADLSSGDFPHEEYSLTHPPRDSSEYWNIAMMCLKRQQTWLSGLKGKPSTDPSAAIEKILKKHEGSVDSDTKKYLGEALKALEEKRKQPPVTNGHSNGK